MEEKKKKSVLSIFKVWFCTGVVLKQIGFKVEFVETFNNIVRNFQLAAVNQSLSLWEHTSWNKFIYLLLLLLLSGRFFGFRMEVSVKSGKGWSFRCFKYQL